MERTDAALLERWQRHRDADAFAELVHRHLGMVVASCRRVVGDPALAEDVAQECFVALMQSQKSVRVSLGAWLHTVAVRRSINHVRSDSRRRKRETVFAEAADSVTSTDVSLEEVLSAVDEAIIDLPDHLRAVVVGRFLESRTHVDLARHLNLSESNVRYRVDKGVDQIRASLRKRGIVASAGVLTAALSQTVEAAPPGLARALCKLAASGAVGAPVVASAGYALFVKAAAGLLVVAALGAGYWAVTNKNSVAPNSPNAVMAPTPPHTASDDARDKSTTPQDAASQHSATATTATPLANGQADPEPFSIEGRVYDADTGVGIEGVGVEVFPSGGGPVVYGDKRKTDMNGVYRTRLIPDGTYQVLIDDIAEYPDARNERDTNVTLKNGKPALGIDFALKKGVLVAGLVVDENGKPVTDAKVVAESATTHGADVVKGESGAEGQFLLYLSNGLDRIDLQAENDALESAVQEGVVLERDGVNGIVLKLNKPKTGSMSGRVIDGNGAPIGGAQIHLLRKDGSVFGIRTPERTNDQGLFRFINLPPTEFAVIVTPEIANGFSTVEEYLRVTLAPGENRSNVEIVYGEKGGLAIEGHVLDAEKRPVKGAEVTCYTRTLERAYSDSSGAFRVTGLEDKEYLVAAQNPADLSQTEVNIRAGTLDAEIVLRKRGRLSGRVMAGDTGAPLPVFTVSHIKGGGDEFGAMLFSVGESHESADGTFSYDNVPPDDMMVAAWAPGYAIEGKHVDIPEGGSADIEFRLTPSPPVSGTVINEAGEAVVGAYVYFVRDIPYDLMERASATRTNAGGQFSIDSLPLDATHLYAHQAGYGVGEVALSQENRIVLPAQATINGIVNQDGTLRDLMASLTYPDNRSLPSQRQKIPASGKFWLTGLSPGTVELYVYPNGGEHEILKTVGLRSGQTLSMAFTFTRGSGTLEGRIVNEGGSTSDLYARLVHNSGDYDEQLHCTTNADGSFHFERVWAGESTLMVYRENPDDPYKPDWHKTRVVLQEGEALVQDIDLSGSGS